MDYIVARMLDEQMAPVGMAFGDISMTAGTVEQPQAQTDTAGNTVEVPQLAETIEASSVDSNRIVSLAVNANTGNSYQMCIRDRVCGSCAVRVTENPSDSQADFTVSSAACVCSLSR